MTRPPFDLLVWYTIRYLGMRTDSGVSYSHLKNYLVPNIMTERRLLDSLKRGDYCGIIRRVYYMDGKKTKYHLELDREVGLAEHSDLFAYAIMAAMVYTEQLLWVSDSDREITGYV